MKSQSGFTLIELIMVIVILGILSAAVAPKFLDLTSDAKIASSKAIYGTIQSASSIAFAKHRASGLTVSGEGDDTFITSCASLLAYMDGGSLPADTDCDGDTMTFPDGKTATLSAETTTTRASMTQLQ